MRDRQHHDAGGPPLPLERVERPSERVAQDQLLETDARAEAEHPRAQPADRPGGDLDHPRRLAVEAQLGVDRPLAQPDRRDRVPRRLGDVVLGGLGKPRRRDVDRLLEERPVEGIGLVEQRQHVQTPPVEQPFQRHLDPRDVAFDQDPPGGLAHGGDVGLVQDSNDAAERGDECLLVVRPDHAAARRQRDGLEHAGKHRLAGGAGRIVVDR